MGPISFEAINVGTERAPAMALARVLRDADIRTDMTGPSQSDGCYRLMVWSEDGQLSKELISEAHLKGADQRP